MPKSALVAEDGKDLGVVDALMAALGLFSAWSPAIAQTQPASATKADVKAVITRLAEADVRNKSGSQRNSVISVIRNTHPGVLNDIEVGIFYDSEYERLKKKQPWWERLPSNAGG